jgi:murein DD-endopeptidase MepM/ murein hydrolase activator NlpD
VIPPRAVIVAALLAALLYAPSAHAVATGGTTPTAPSAPSGGVVAGDPDTAAAPRKRKKRPVSRPVLTALKVSRTQLYDYGAPLRVSFRIDGGPRSLPVRLDLVQGGKRVQSIPLGTLTTRAGHSYVLGAAGLPLGTLEVRVHATHLRRGPHASAAVVFQHGDHRFPLVGPFNFGGPDARFGATRNGHTHQGQDVIAAQGTPIVAPRGGTVTAVAYQAGGAGYYVVVSGAGEDIDYAFMHLVAGSTRVHVGEVIATGQRIGDVGATGDATGPHLHFEMWVGAWQAGGHPIDPLPYLQRWAT